MKKLLLCILGLFTINTIQAQYCTPSLNCSSSSFINNFSTTGGTTNITNNGTGCNGQPGSYIYYSTQTVTQTQGLSINFTVQSGSFDQGFRIWVDWNQDGDFTDPGEDVYVSPTFATTPFSGTITVPMTATPGITRMRVMSRFFSVPANNPCDNSNSPGEVEDYNFDVVAAPPCVAPPTAGTTLSTQDSVCFNVPFTLSLTGTSTGSGITYQWISAPTASGPWTPITGATNPTHTTTLTATTFYRCIVTCSSQSDTSTIIQVIRRNLVNCYCTSNATSTTFGYIQNVTFNTINNTSPTGCGQQYTNYTNLSTTVIKGNVYLFSTEIAGCSGGSWTHSTKVYIDYNQNGLLTDPGEEVLALGPAPYNTFTGNITIPATANTGTTLMRVVTVETSDMSNVTPCGTYTWGETEDYLVNIIDPPAIDINVRALTSPPLPLYCYTNCEPINVLLRNDGLNTIDFSVDPMTVSVDITGVNPQLYSTTVNTGSLLVGDSMVVTVASCYDMSAFGTYNFRPYANIATDGNVFNDSLNIITITTNNSPGTASINRNSICLGDSATLTLSGNSGALQWQFSTDGGLTWNNVSGPGSNATPFTVSPNDTIQYRAQVCGTLNSNVITLNVNSVTNATGTGASRCGYGPVNLTASGTGVIKWYTDSIGGSLLHTGTNYSPLVGQSDTFWVENNLVSGGGSVGKPINFSGSGTVVLNRGLIFNTTTEIVIDSVMVYPIGSGTIQVALRDNANNIITTSAIIPVTGSGLGVYIPLNFTVPVGTGYQLTLNATSGFSDLWFDNTGNTYPYTSPGGEVSITNGWTGSVTSTAYFYFYDWKFSRVCASPRTPVIVNVTPAPAMSVSPNPAYSCQGTPVTLSVNTSHTGYNFTWSPASGLSNTTGASVSANPTTTTNYVVSAIDGAGCTAYDTVRVEVTPVAQISATANRNVICGNDTTMLMSNIVGGAIQNFIIGTGNITNTTTSYPAPYGNWFWGARHQFLITAAEMIAAGATAGPLINLAFDVVAVNTNPALQNFTIRMGHTNATNMNAWITTGLTTVFSVPSYQPTLGLNVHTFNTPFIWDGVSNIVIETCFNNSSWTNNCTFNQTSTPYVSSRWYFADAPGVCTNTSQSGTASQRPNIRFQRLNTYSFAWSPASAVSNPNTQNTIAIPNGVSTNYIVTLTDSVTGCTSSDSVQVTVNPVPQPNLGPDTSVCAGQQFILTPGGNFNTYLWNDGSIGQLLIVNGISTPQTFWVQVSNSFGCTKRDSINISINPSPNINLGNDTTICKNHTLTLNAGGGFTSYLWNTGATTPTITIPQGSITSVYYVTVTNSFGCSDSDTILVTVSPCTGIDEEDGIDGVILLYPNPSRGQFNIAIDLPGAESAQIEIINSQGRVVYQSTITNSSAYRDVIDLTGNASGVYYVRVISDKYTGLSKIMLNN